MDAAAEASAASPFAEAALDIVRWGLIVIPVAADDKRPLIANFTKSARPPGTVDLRRWSAQWPHANIGVVTGAVSGVTVVDVDSAELVEYALAHYGDTPCQVSTPSGGLHLYYSHSGERNAQKVAGKAIDIRGEGGFVLVPPSQRADDGQYIFVKGGWPSIRNLPTISATKRSNSVPSLRVQEGERNDTLFGHCLRQAPHVDDLETLIDVARTANADYEPPLQDRDVIKCAKSAWRYETKGSNWVSTKGRVVIDGELLPEFAANPDAFYLLSFLRREHEGRHETFAICAGAMFRDEVLPGWRSGRIARARKWLCDHNFLDTQHRGGRGPGDASQYRFKP